MNQVRLSLQPAEGVVVQAAATIYASYVGAGRVPEGQEEVWLERSLREALFLAKVADENIISSGEMGA